jgi:hypothetical protein
VLVSSDIIMPDPSELSFTDKNQVLVFDVVNKNQREEIEVAYSSKWTCATETIVPAGCARRFILYNISGDVKELYMV